MTKIRDATEADLTRILEIINEAILNTTSSFDLAPTTLDQRRIWLNDRQGRGFPVLVAERDGEVIGFGSFGSFRLWDGYIGTVEHSIYVAPAFQRRGAGKALLAALIQKAEALRLHVMIGGIESGNTISIELHRRMGFEESGRLREVGRKFDRWLDLVLMQKLLPNRSS